MGDMQIPKKHSVVHMLARIPYSGNPKDYASWMDESLNKDLRNACRKTTAFQNFERNLYIKMRAWLKNKCAKIAQ